MLSQADLERCQKLVYAHMNPTPTLCWPLLNEAGGCEVWVKHENHTPIGAFKVRGGLVYLEELQRAGSTEQIVTATRGNHGQSIPYAARLQNRTTHVFVPPNNSAEKNAAMRGWGAVLHEAGVDFDKAREAATAYAEQVGGHIDPSFHEHLVGGVATYAAEMWSHIPDLDVVYVPVGMGSGAAALVSVRDLLGLRTQVVGVVSDKADAFAQSFELGTIVHTETAATFADGVATRMPHPDAFAILSKGLDRVVRVSDDEVAEAMRILYRTTHNVAEGAGAAATAALIQEQTLQPHTNRKAAVVLTGGNIDTTMLKQVLAGQTPVVM